MPPYPRKLPYAAIVALGLTGIYSATLLPGVGFTGDTAKFQYVGTVLGIPHEPGYPLYTLLNYLWVHVVPLGSIALRANLLSAFFGVVTCLLMYRAMRVVADQGLAAAFAISIGLSKQFWINSVVAEIYTLAMLFLAAILLCLIRAIELRSLRWASAALFIWGVSLSHHPLLLPALPATLIALGICNRQWLRRPPVWGALLSGVGVGLAFYSYLFFRTADTTTPFVEFEVWGLRDLIQGLSGGKFHGQMFSIGLREQLMERFPAYLEGLFNQLGPVVLLVPLGVRDLNRSLAAFVTVIVASNAFIYLNYDIPDIEVYLLPSTLVLHLVGAVGMQRLLLHAKRVPRRALPSLVPIVLLAANFGIANKADNAGGSRMYRDALTSLPPQAVVWEPWYVGNQYLSYYMLAEDIGASNNVALAGITSNEALIEYLEGARPLASTIGRRLIPLDRPVFVVSQRIRNALIEAGFEVGPGERAWPVRGAPRPRVIDADGS